MNHPTCLNRASTLATCFGRPVKLDQRFGGGSSKAHPEQIVGCLCPETSVLRGLSLAQGEVRPLKSEIYFDDVMSFPLEQEARSCLTSPRKQLKLALFELFHLKLNGLLLDAQVERRPSISLMCALAFKAECIHSCVDVCELRVLLKWFAQSEKHGTNRTCPVATCCVPLSKQAYTIQEIIRPARTIIARQR